jgi:hypothetical protein
MLDAGLVGKIRYLVARVVDRAINRSGRVNWYVDIVVLDTHEEKVFVRLNCSSPCQHGGKRIKRSHSTHEQ